MPSLLNHHHPTTPMDYNHLKNYLSLYHYYYYYYYYYRRVIGCLNWGGVGVGVATRSASCQRNFLKDQLSFYYYFVRSKVFDNTVRATSISIIAFIAFIHSFMIDCVKNTRSFSMSFVISVISVMLAKLTRSNKARRYENLRKN